MEKCEYQSVENNDVCEINKTKPFVWKTFFRQLLVCSGVWTSVFMIGIGVGAPTVIIPQIRREANSTYVVTDEMASWLSSIYFFSGFPFVLILSIVTRFVGRKIPFMIACVETLAAFIILYRSTTFTHVIIGQVMLGFTGASEMVVNTMIMTEYTSPKYRGIFLTLKSATFFWGIWASNAIGTFLHWKKIALFGMACASYSLVTVIIWPESPYWLANRGKFEQSARSHRWLKGCDEESEKELEALLTMQRKYVSNNNDKKLPLKEKVLDFFKTIKRKEFYKPTLLAILAGTLSIFSGKLICTVYALDILKKITSSESAAYTGMLILDAITVFSMYCGCVISRYFKRRTLLLGLSCVTVMFLLIISLYLYLVSIEVVGENKYVSVLFLIGFSIAVSCGPLIMTTSIYGELIPVRSRNLSACTIALIGKISIGVMLKTAPYIFKLFGIHGAFLLFAASSSVCILLLYKYLPETKDKTLQEIAESMKGSKSKSISVIKPILVDNS